MSFERMRQSFKSFLGLNASPQIDQSSQVSIPQELKSSNSQCIIRNKFVQIEKKQERLNPYKKSLIRLNEYYKTIVKGTDFSKCPTIQYQINEDEKPAIDHKTCNPRWKREDQSQDCSSYRWSSYNEFPNPTQYKIQSKPTKNQVYDPSILSQSREKQASINFQKKQFLSYLEDKPISVINEIHPIEDKKKKSSQISIRRADSFLFDDQEEPIYEKGRQAFQKSDNTIKPTEEDNQSASENIVIKKQPLSKFCQIKKQEFEFNPKIETPNSSILNKEEQQKPLIQLQQNIIKIPDEQIQQQQEPIQQKQQEPPIEVKQEPIIQQKTEPLPQSLPLTQQSVIEVNPFTSNIESPLFSAPWITNQQPIISQNQSTFNLFQSQPIQNQFQAPFITQQPQQQPVFPFQNQTQPQQSVFTNENFFSQQIQPSSNQFMNNQISQNVFNQNNSFQTQSPFTQNQPFQQSQSYSNDLFGMNQSKTINNNNNNFLFQTNSLGGGSFSADDQNKPRTIDLFSAQPAQNSQTSMMTSQAPVNLFALDQNSQAQPQTNKESDRYKNKFKQNTVKYNTAAQRME
ncbi:unnamed protein product [Paramecium primaurelia]|uniref:Uncharacterized protein n=1 Tax=Paramecium primaurelia TaxID=5886 RepID=A0A8S1QMP3_PARPR|nr:unnamed protein product [Paramecium primaurelia]